MISLTDVSGKPGVLSAGRLQREWGVLGKVSAGGFSRLDVAYGSKGDIAGYRRHVYF
jgi:hypothetical protein